MNPPNRKVEDAEFIGALRMNPSITVRQLGERVGLLSSSAVHDRLARLEREGRIARVECGTCRSVVWAPSWGPT